MSPALPTKEENSPLAGGADGYESDFLEQEKESNARAAGLREDRINSMRGEGGQSEEKGAQGKMGNNVAQDQSEMAKKRDLSLDRRISKQSKKGKNLKIDANKLSKAAAKKAARFLVQKGLSAAVAAFLATGIGYIVGWVMALGRLIAAEVFNVESQKFDSIIEELAYWVIVIIGLLIILIAFMLMITFIIAQYGWIIAIYNIFN